MQRIHQTKQFMQIEAQNLGFELVYSDLRTGCFHIKQGSTVRMGFVWRNIKQDDIAAQMKSTSQYGDRLDTLRGSIYCTL
jgi:hypothetical protein